MTDDELREAVLTRTHELTIVPAPWGEEAERAAVVRGWWATDGLREVHDDAAGNVLALLRRGTTGRGVFVCAHLDTVFERAVDHAVRPGEAGRLHGPGIGDNTVAVAAIGALRGLVDADGEGHDVWLVATVGEEGLGNLRGAKHLVASRPDLAALIAVEGSFLGRVCLAGNGSVRARVTVEGPGGHSWGDRDRDPATHGLARAVALLDAERPGREAGWSWHVAAVHGGGDINVLASSASFTFEIRAPDPESLGAHEARARSLIAEGAGERGLTWSWEELGRRPGGRLDATDPLALAAFAAHDRHGIAYVVEDAGTDANAALGVGLPALTVGLTVGEDIHTLREWIDPEPIPRGLRMLADLASTAATGRARARP